MNKRKFNRNKKVFKGPSRSESVYNALMSGECVECGHLLDDIPSNDPSYIGGEHVRCPSCGWEASTESSF